MINVAPLRRGDDDDRAATKPMPSSNEAGVTQGTFVKSLQMFRPRLARLVKRSGCA
jgi:hypothetical protein